MKSNKCVVSNKATMKMSFNNHKRTVKDKVPRKKKRVYPENIKSETDTLFENMEWSVDSFIDNATDDTFVLEDEKHAELLEEDEQYDFYNSRGNDEERLTAYGYNMQMYKLIRDMIRYTGYAKPKLVRGMEAEEKEFLKCKYDIVYFLENYCRIPAPGGSVKLLLNDRLRAVAKLFEASVITNFMTSRQSSKTTIMLACYAWYYNFWTATSSLLINLTVGDNKKNISIIKNIIKDFPKYLKVWNPEKNKNDVDNVYEIVSGGSNSRLSGLVINKTDADSSGRGKTGALYYDEIAYLEKISEAYGSIAFVYNQYSKMARAALIPAPFVTSSTPNDLNNESGVFFHNLWTNAFLLEDYNLIKDKLPFEIYEWFLDLGVQGVSVLQPWYEFPGRVSDPAFIDPENPNNLLYLYNDINVSMEVLREKDPIAARWLLESKQTCAFDLRKIKKDIYLMWLSSSESAVFDEATTDILIRSKTIPFALHTVPRVQDKLEIYKTTKEYDFSNAKLLMNIDPAFTSSQNGDYLSIMLTDIETKEVIAHLRTRTGRIGYIAEIANDIFTKFFPNAVVNVERNNFGVAVIEKIQDDFPIMAKRLFYTNPLDSKGRPIFDVEKRIYGTNTSKSSRELMFNLLLNTVNEQQEILNSPKLIDELLTLEYRGSKIQAIGKQHDDSVMSYAIGLHAIEYSASILNKFFFNFKKIAVNLAMISVANNSRGKSLKQLSTDLAKAKMDVLHDSPALSAAILGDFQEDVEKKLSPLNMFTDLNSS